MCYKLIIAEKLLVIRLGTTVVINLIYYKFSVNVEQKEKERNDNKEFCFFINFTFFRKIEKELDLLGSNLLKTL